MKIHPAAILDKQVELAEDVEIGANSIIHGNVKIGKQTRIYPNVYIEGNVEIGENCTIFPYATLGTPPQDLKYRGEETRLVIGSNNILREYVNVNCGTAGGGGVTQIGDQNVVMAFSHIAHDCQIGDHTILANAATLAGHVLIQDYATVGAFSGIHQFCRIGRYSFIGGYSVITKDTFPYCKTVGNRPKIYGLNVIGLRRRGFSEERIAFLKKVFRIFFQSKLNTKQAVEKIRDELELTEEIAYILEFVESSKRGIIKR